MTNQILFIKYLDNQPVPIETHYTGELERRRPLSDVYDVIYAVKQALASYFAATPINKLSLHAAIDGVESPALESDLLLSDLSVGRTAKTALIIKANLRFALADDFIATSSAEEVEDSSVISIFSSYDPPVLLISVPSRPLGRPWNRVLLFLQVVCGNFDTTDYTLHHKVSGALATFPLDDYSNLLLPGSYYILPNHGDHLTMSPTVQKSGLNIARKFSVGDSFGRSQPNNSRVEELSNEDDESTVDGETQSSSRFRERVIARDNHCVVTRNYSSLEAVHILSHSVRHEGSNREDLLPVNLKNIVSSLDGGIDNIRNGILLRKDLASAFDEGKFSFVFRDEHFYFIAITTDYMDYDGIQLDENLRDRSDGTSWWSVENRPHARLMEFHLRKSVVRRMSPAESVNEEWGFESDILEDEIFESNSDL
ncbi:hypothetical protein BCR33DRAFT_75912 [Rhizoclosmatium globosum]|uniref:HNH nuclease domain-containing protein n=1 Tax=Rhizoclosmatium globosum TaxID=329046 RepID=A0A1Y2CKV1_9FUNG|nr:hypothetical protein BCR33DRAFT_75912 [Rhizoclosmatium globosum]|eukprot:ORY47648.1 hypothetical protein BCR33DRAFT_75912 [Rhizoclosmatium globosum]